MFAYRTHSELSPFALIERAFTQLGTAPRPLVIDGTGLAGLRAGPIRLDEVRARLLHPSTPYATRDTAVHVLIGRARADGDLWMVGLAGVLLPGLRRAVGPLVAACPARAADLEAEMLTGLIVAVGRCDPDRARPAGFLCGRAFDAAKRLLRAEISERARPGDDPLLAVPSGTVGHPDLTLARAVAAGVIRSDDAELIGVTRLGEMSLADAATARGLSYKAAERRRHRAETSLVAWLWDGFVADRRIAAGSTGVGRPRQGHRPRPRPRPQPLSRPSTQPAATARP